MITAHFSRSILSILCRKQFIQRLHYMYINGNNSWTISLLPCSVFLLLILDSWVSTLTNFLNEYQWFPLFFLCCDNTIGILQVRINATHKTTCCTIKEQHNNILLVLVFLLLPLSSDDGNLKIPYIFSRVTMLTRSPTQRCHLNNKDSPPIPTPCP